MRNNLIDLYFNKGCDNAHYLFVDESESSVLLHLHHTALHFLVQRTRFDSLNLDDLSESVL